MREIWQRIEIWLVAVAGVVALWLIIMVAAVWAGKHVVLPLVNGMR